MPLFKRKQMPQARRTYGNIMKFIEAEKVPNIFTRARIRGTPWFALKRFVPVRYFYRSIRKGYPRMVEVLSLYERFAPRLEETVKRAAGNPSVASIACGKGTYEMWLGHRIPNAKIEGTDLYMWRDAKKRRKNEGFQNVRFHSGSFSNPKLKGRYDVVMCMDALQWAGKKWKGTIGKFRALMKEGPNSRLAIYYLSPHERVKIGFDEFRRVLESNGLEIVSSENVPYRNYTGSMYVEARLKAKK